MKPQIIQMSLSALVLLVLRSFADQSPMQAQEPGLMHPRQQQRTALGEATAGKPFIRPIAPMGSLFANEMFFHTPLSEAGLHPRPARFHSRPATRQVVIGPQANTRLGVDPEIQSSLRPDPGPGPSPSVLTSDSLTPLGRLFYERTKPSFMPSSPTALRPLSSVAMPTATISPARALQIQAALVQFGYLVDKPSGSWDAASIAAIRKLQSDHRWQTKFMPDARALILLGLGPGSKAP